MSNGGRLTIAVFLLCLTYLFTPCVCADGEPIKVIDWLPEEYKICLIIVSLVIFVIVFKNFYPRIPVVSDCLPESLLLLLLGLAVGFIITKTSNALEGVHFILTPPVFFNFFFPPIVLQSAYSLSNRTFADYVVSVLFFAVVGTLLNFFLVGIVLYAIHAAGGMEPGLVPMNITLHFLFASLIVAVDPVAVLAIFQEIGVNLGLYYTVFGESLLNDAVTVVLFDIMSEYVQASSITAKEIGFCVAALLTVSLGAALIGVVVGAISSLATRWSCHYDSLLLIFFALFAYFISDCLRWSGIIAMICCGFVQSGYAFHNISHTSRTVLIGIVRQTAEVSEAVVFFLLGAQTPLASFKWSTGFCIWSYVVCTLSRAIVVVFLAFVLNRARLPSLHIAAKEQLIIIYGGLRGAVAYVLAFMVTDLPHVPEEVKQLIVCSTLFIIAVTVGFQGITMKPLVRLARIKLADIQRLSIFKDISCRVSDHTMAGLEAIVGSRGRNRFREVLSRFDNKVIRKVLQCHPETHDEKILRIYEKIALNLHYATVKPDQRDKYLDRLPKTVVRKFLAPELVEESASDEALLPLSQDVITDAPRKHMKRLGRRMAMAWIPESQWEAPNNMFDSSLCTPLQDDYKRRYLKLLRRKSLDLAERDPARVMRRRLRRDHSMQPSVTRDYNTDSPILSDYTVQGE